MQCQSFNEILDAYACGELNESQKRDADSHAVECEPCAKQLRLRLQMRDVLTSHRVPPMPSDFAKSVVAKATHDRISVSQISRRMAITDVFNRPVSGRAFAWRAALSIVIGLTIGTLMGRQSFSNPDISSASRAQEPSPRESLADTHFALSPTLVQHQDSLAGTYLTLVSYPPSSSEE
jgi:anti-sigma factor RsiW